MSDESIDENPVGESATDNVNASRARLEKNLIQALTRLQHTAFDSAFLDDKTERVAELPPESFLGFVVGQYHFIVHATCFCEVFVDTPIAALPNAPECLAGLSNIRGVLMPVYQLHSALKLTPTTQKPTTQKPITQKPITQNKVTIFCIGKGDAAIGLLIDALPHSLSLSTHQRKKNIDCKEALLTPLIKTSYFFNQHEWLLLDGNLIAEQLQALAMRANKLSSSLTKINDKAAIEKNVLGEKGRDHVYF